MSFALTTPQVERRLKTVTRRIGWAFLRVGDRLLAVDKQRVKDARKLAVIEVVSVRDERLDAIDAMDVGYEGFLYSTRREFVEMFCREMGCTSDTIVRRIEFAYVDPPTMLLPVTQRALAGHA